MRPLKLTMSAFGPYSEEEIIDFELLGESGLFLITGDTGAGKTTIFDGISYALFGETSGRERESKSVRNTDAAMSGKAVETFVEFEFEYKSKKYKIKRNPEYERPAKRGGGTTVQKSDCVMIKSDSSVVSGNTQVLNEVKALLGIDRNQFRQIVMLAQGDFQRLLYSSTEEKSSIFRRLFDTVNYNSLQTKISESYNQLRSRYSDCDKSLKALLEKLDLDCEASDVSYDDAAAALKKKIEALKKQRADIKSETDKNRTNTDEIIKLLEKINGQNKIFENYQKSFKNLQSAENEAVRLAESFKQAEKNKAQADILKSSADGIKAVIPQYETLDEIRSRGVALRKSLDNRKAEIMQEKQKRLQLEEDLKLQKNQLDKFMDCEKTAGEIKLEINRLKESENRYCSAFKADTALTEAQKEYLQLQTEYSTLRKSAESVSAEYDRIYYAYIDNQAGFIAAQLMDGEKCPVCGSTEHPEPAMLSESAISKQQVDKAKSIAENARKALEECGNKSAACVTGCENIKAQRDDILLQLGIQPDAESLAEQLKNEIRNIAEKLAELDAELKTTEKNIELKGRLLKAIPALEDKIELIRKNISQLESLSASDETAIGELRKQFADTQKNLKFKTLDEAQNEIARFELQSKKITDEYDLIKRSCDMAAQTAARLRGETESFENQLEKKECTDTSGIEKQKNDLFEISKKLSEEDNRLFALIQSCENALADAAQLKRSQDEIIGKLSWLQPLWATINGQTSGKDKMNLETYVQAVYFERIIRRANRRFMEITDGRYDMKRRETAENQRSKSGLDLDVIDHYSGAERSVKTLSGGESFQASLALALGLSDEIQSFSGGIQLDALFIDEGFGSLDETSLSQAVTTLIKLSRSNRLVGIISHVSELKSRIPKQIVITKSPSDGSHAEVKA